MYVHLLSPFLIDKCALILILLISDKPKLEVVPCSKLYDIVAQLFLL